MLTFLRKIRISLIESGATRPRPNESSLSERTSVQAGGWTTRSSLSESTSVPAGGRVRKYLFCAIGEMALVVIGIPIALHLPSCEGPVEARINNWDEFFNQLKRCNVQGVYVIIYAVLARLLIQVVQRKVPY